MTININNKGILLAASLVLLGVFVIFLVQSDKRETRNSVGSSIDDIIDSTHDGAKEFQEEIEDEIDDHTTNRR